MANPHDQVFQLSLTEIAFTLVFILLLLMGWMIHEADTRQAELETIITEAGEAQARQNRLQDAKRALEAEALAGLAFKKEVARQMHEQLGKSYPNEDEATLAKELVAAVKEVQTLRDVVAGPSVLAAENSDLRGQVAFLKGKLEAHGGRDYPPCWADETTGRVEYLFAIEILPEGLKISRSWPAKRQANAEALPQIEKLTAARTHRLEEFNTLMQGIDRVSKEKNCRHYVTIKNRVNDLELFNRYRYGIENYFYKFEVRG